MIGKPPPTARFALSWAFANTKLKKLDAVGFGLPAFQSADGFRVCPKAGACSSVCFARQGFYNAAWVAAPRERNLAAARADLAEFELMAAEDLLNLRPSIVRLHDSGDFFSQDYLDAWYAVARAFPDKTFYTYTKSLHLDLWSRKPVNFQLVQSEGGLLDERIDPTRPRARIFSSLEAMAAAGYEDGHETDELAIAGRPRIGLLYHGARALTPAQEAFFS